MSEKEFPEESEKTIYQRDKTAKEPVAPSDAPKPVIKPKIKKKKVFVPKKVSYTTDKQMEFRVRHIRISSMDMAGVIRDTLIEFQEELAIQPTDDPDKEFHDREKLEAFFSRLAKKYSICGTRKLGGDIGWVYKGMKISEEVMTEDLLEILLKTEKYFIPEPIKTRLGIHLVLVCESQIHVPKETAEPDNRPNLPPAGTNIPT
jgi:parvulin-like peptidyl-prolyl isomerase